jgi:hypothetical protein
MLLTAPPGNVPDLMKPGDVWKRGAGPFSDQNNVSAAWATAADIRQAATAVRRADFI